MLHKTDTHVLG